MNLLIYSGQKMFENSYYYKQYLHVVELLQSLNFKVIILLPFANDSKITYMKYKDLLENNIELSKAFQECDFVTYKYLNYIIINQVINDFNVKLIINIFEHLIDKEDIGFKCQSILWDFDEFTNKEDLLSKNDLYDKIICHSPYLYTHFKEFLPNKPIFYLPSIINGNKSINESINESYKYPLIIANINMDDEMALDALFKAWNNISIDRTLLLFSENRIEIQEIMYQLPTNFKIGDTYILKYNGQEILIPTSVKTHSNFKNQYYHLIKKDRLDNYIKQKGLKNIIAPKDIDILDYLPHSDKYIDLTKGKFGYIIIQNAIANNLYCLMINSKDTDKILVKGELINSQSYNVNKTTIFTYNIEDIQQFILRQPENYIEYENKLSKYSLKEIIEYSVFKSFINLYSEKVSFVQTKDIQHLESFIIQSRISKLVLSGEVDIQLMAYLFSQCRYIKNILWIKPNELNDYEKNKLNHIHKYFKNCHLTIKTNISNKPIQELINHKPSQLFNLLLIDIDKYYNNNFTILLNKNYIINLYLVNKTFTFYKIVPQKERYFYDFKQVKLTNSYLMIEDDGFKYTIKKQPEYDLDIFYGVPVSDLLKKQDWHQLMIVDRYLHYKNNLTDPNQFIRFFRHRILWEELYESKIPHMIIQEIQSDKLTSFSIPTKSFYLPDIDIIFFKQKFNMEYYYISRAGLKILLDNTRPMIYPLHIQIEYIYMSNKISCHCIGLIPETIENNSLHRVEPEIIIEKPLPLTIQISNYLFNTFNGLKYITWSTFTLPLWIYPFSKKIYYQSKNKLINFLLDYFLKSKY